MRNHSTNNNQHHNKVSNILITTLRNMEAGHKNSLLQYKSTIRVRHILQSSTNVQHT